MVEIYNIGGVVHVDDVNESVSSSNGALRVAGGIGVLKSVNIGGALSVDEISNLDALAVAEGATFSGHVNISGVTTTGENLGGFKRLVGAGSSTVVSIAVTVAT